MLKTVIRRQGYHYRWRLFDFAGTEYAGGNCRKREQARREAREARWALCTMLEKGKKKIL